MTAAVWRFNARWIQVSGTGDDAALGDAATAVARAIGTALAGAGYGLVTGGWTGVDRIVGEAYVARLKELGVDPTPHFKQIVHRGQNPSVRAGNVIFVDEGVTEYMELVKHPGALVLIAGRGGTYQTSLFSLAHGRPVLPIAAAEGDARRAYNEIRQGWDGQTAYAKITLPQFEQLDASIAEPDEIVAVVLGLLERLLGGPEAAATPPAPATTPAPVAAAPAVDVEPALGADNEKVLRELVACFRDPGIVGFIGAGASMQAGYPGWGALLDRLEAEIADSPMQPKIPGIRSIPDMLWRADRYRRELDRRYPKLMREIFGPRVGTHGSFHLDLVRLPFRQVVTTNYDDLLERAHAAAFGELPERVEWHNEELVQEFVGRLGSAAAPRQYFYLHGRYDNAADIVLTEDDYQRLYAKGGVDARLAAVFGQRHLFIGFSLTDLDVMAVFRRLKAQIGYAAPRHFALMPLESGRDDWAVRTWLNEKYGVEPVFYRWTRDHAELHALIRRIAAALQPAA